MLVVVETAHYHAFSVQSDFARTMAQDVAAAASLGYITTESPLGFGRRWRATADGLLFCQEVRSC